MWQMCTLISVIKATYIGMPYVCTIGVFTSMCFSLNLTWFIYENKSYTETYIYIIIMFLLIFLIEQVNWHTWGMQFSWLYSYNHE